MQGCSGGSCCVQVGMGCLLLLLLLLKKGGMRWEAGRPHKHMHKTITAPRWGQGCWRLLRVLLKQKPSAGVVLGNVNQGIGGGRGCRGRARPVAAAAAGCGGSGWLAAGWGGRIWRTLCCHGGREGGPRGGPHSSTTPAAAAAAAAAW